MIKRRFYEFEHWDKDNVSDSSSSSSFSELEGEAPKESESEEEVVPIKENDQACSIASVGIAQQTTLVLTQQRHARSEKLLKEGRLKTMLNSDGEIENQEAAEETDAPVDAVAQEKQKRKHKGGRNRRGKGSKRKRTREGKKFNRNGAKRGRKNES
ncbi:hypothetical protein DITRI_Ditri15bG0053400 [Diplodiscus trichospermus]